MMTSCVGVCFPVVADTSSEGQESEELGLSGENAARLRRENSGMLQLMHTLVTILSVGFSMQVCMCGDSVCVECRDVGAPLRALLGDRQFHLGLDAAEVLPAPVPTGDHASRIIH